MSPRPTLRLPATPLRWRDAPVDRTGEAALVAFWRQPTAARARTYVAALGPIIRRAHAVEEDAGRAVGPLRPPRSLSEPEWFGPYRADRELGHGGDGWALRARHAQTGRVVTIKAPARGDGWVLLRLGRHPHAWHPRLVRVLDGEQEAPPSVRYHWVAREYADGTLAETLAARSPLPRDEVRAIFATCCEVVAWLHARHIYRWSAHAKNVYRFGDGWKVGDMGRSLCFVPTDHPLLRQMRQTFRQASGTPLDDAALDRLVTAHSWGHPTGGGFLPLHPEREARLRQDDCAMLAGLLCTLLTGRRWVWFDQAVHTQPYASAHYALTGDHGTDVALSAVLNRAWRGDAGGALLLANGRRGEQTVYDDALALLADVEAALARA